MRNLSRQDVEQFTSKIIENREEMVLVEILDGSLIWLNKHDVSITPHLLKEGYWEAWITSWFTKNVSDGDVILDIGANCGYYSVLFSRLVGPNGVIVAYEANPEYAELIKRTGDANGVNIEVEGVAISDKIGVACLTFPGNYTGSASIVEDSFDKRWGETTEISVMTTTLDEDWKRYTAPDLVKMDIEGAEELAWNGGWTLWNADPHAPVVVLEYSPGMYSTEFVDMLFDYGDVTKINYEGEEDEIQPLDLELFTDWQMLVIRRKA